MAETSLRLYECPCCRWLEKMEGSLFGLRRPRCPWDGCEAAGLLMSPLDPALSLPYSSAAGD